MRSDDRNRAAAVAGESLPAEAAAIRHRWWWVEQSVWTDRRLTRLEGSEPSSTWFTLGQSNIGAQSTRGLLGGLAPRRCTRGR